MSEYTPTRENIRDCYARYGNETTRTAEFNRAIAAHDRALREQIVREIETFGDSSGVGAYGDYGPPAIAVSDAARITRGEGSE